MSIRVACVDGLYSLTDGDAPIQEANVYLGALKLRGLSPLTVRAYAYDLVLLYRWLEANGLTLRELTASRLLEFISEQRKVAADPQSINRRLSTARLLYRFHHDADVEHHRVSLPAPHYKGPGRDHILGLHRLRKRRALQLRVKVAHKLVEPLTPKQVRAFLGRLTRYRDLAIVYLMLLCGFRSCEVIRLTMHDVVFGDRQIRIQGKGKRERVIPLPDTLALVLRQYLAIERPKRCEFDRVFVVLQGPRRGSPMSAAGLRSLFRHRRLIALLASANAHRFRHTFGTDMARAGVRLPVLQKMMGHADAKTTLQYIQLSMADIAAEYQRAIVELDKRYGRKSAR
jgi:integrase/recombinase XerD